MRIDKGFSLVELTLATFLGVLILTVMTSTYVFTIASSNSQLKYSTLKSELDSLLFLMANEVKRAGYCGNCTTSNGFMITDISGDQSAIVIDDSATKASGTCIRFSYNHDSAENIVSVRDKDARGFRLFDSDKDGIDDFEVYTNYGGLANWGCGNTHTHWQNYNNQMITIKALSFDRSTYLSAVSGAVSSMQNIDITIQGQLGSMLETRTITVSVPNVDK